MKTDKELKREFKVVTSVDPDKYYATTVLKKEGFMRKKCKCGLWFWTTNKYQNVCGDPACFGGFNVVKNNPASKKLTYPEVWFEFKKLFKEFGYKPIKRYPVVARWNPTTDFTIASIAAFQPYVINGEVEPPAKKIVIPQFCLRFNDVDNVGVTGAHCTGFVMIGQHQFVSPTEWDQNKAFEEIYTYVTKGVGLPKEELTLHEDAWAGGGNFGPCMEFFSRGVELFNQVYMMFEHTDSGDKELDIKVLDMGLGMERIAWFSQGKANMYEAIFPAVLKKLEKITNVKYDIELFKKFSPYAAWLNFDEVDDINKAWDKVGEKLGLTGEELKEKILPMTALYSIAEHTRSLLFAISDGGLPSNVGGGYNLRVILRRALSFIDQFSWNVKLKEVAKWHAEELKEIFPELDENLPQVEKILDVETIKYKATKEKAKSIVERLLKREKEIKEEELIELYDSHGIQPEQISIEARKHNKKIIVPDNFYSKVAEIHEKKQQKTATVKEKQLDIPDSIIETGKEYWKDYKLTESEAKIVWLDKKLVVLDKTIFYPTSGGQLNDLGTINSVEVVDVFKSGPHIVHELKEESKELTVGNKVKCKIDLLRREQLTQHHTATHIVNGAAKKVLGNHIWQAGAAKTTKKARLDITHFDNISKEEMQQIEDYANEIIKLNKPVYKKIMQRNLAEAEYGFVLYQGGAVPGKEIRVVNIPGIDVEACGGTHLNLTGEAEQIKLLKTTKIQDGIVRIEFAAGQAAEKALNQEDDLIEEVAKVLGVTVMQVPARSQELFSKWKKGRKAIKKKKKIELLELDLCELNNFSGEEHEVLEEVANILSTQPQHVVKTINRFMTELNEFKQKINEL